MENLDLKKNGLSHAVERLKAMGTKCELTRALGGP